MDSSEVKEVRCVSRELFSLTNAKFFYDRTGVSWIVNNKDYYEHLIGISEADWRTFTEVTSDVKVDKDCIRNQLDSFEFSLNLFCQVARRVGYYLADTKDNLQTILKAFSANPKDKLEVMRHLENYYIDSNQKLEVDWEVWLARLFTYSSNNIESFVLAISSHVKNHKLTFSASTFSLVISINPVALNNLNNSQTTRNIKG